MENNEGLTPEELEASRERGKKILLERAKKHYGVEEFPDKGTIGTFLQGAGEGLVDDLPLTILRALRHGDVGTEKGWFGQLLDEGIREQISDQSKRVPPKGVIEGSEWDRSFYEGGKNLPTSFGVPLTGAVVGGAVGGQPGAVVGAGALSYPVFYYSAKDAFVEDIYNLVGKRMKPEKWEQYRDLIEESAQTAATAEGGFEAASSMLEAAVGLVPIAKFIPKKLIKNAIGRFILGASGKVATTAGIEIPSEMGTELVQSNEMAKYTGETPITPYEAAKRVGGPTAVASLVGAGGYSLAGKMSKRRGNEQDDSNAPPDIDDSNVPPDIDDSNAPPRNVPPPESETDANTTYPEADYFDVKRTKNGISEIDTQLSQIEKEFYDNPDNADKSVKVLPGYQSLLQKRSALERSLTRKYGSADLSELSDDDVIELEAANFDSMTVSKSPFQSRPLSDANRYADPLFVEPSMPGPVAPIFPSNERKAEPPPVNTAPIITPEQQQEIDSRSYLQRSQERLERILSTDDANEIDSILKENAAEPIRDIEITSRLMDVATSKKKPKTWQEIKQDQLQGEPLTTSPLDIPPADKPWAATSQNNIVDEQVKDDSAESEDAPLSEKKRLEDIQQPSDTQAGQQPPQDDSEVIANTRTQLSERFAKIKETKKQVKEEAEKLRTPILVSKDKKRGVIIHPSTKSPGQWQVTYWDEKGFSGDTTRKTKAEAINEAIQDYRIIDPERFEEVSRTKEFLGGNLATENAMKKLNAAFAEKDKQKADEKAQIGAERPILNPTAKDNMDLSDLNNFDRTMEIRKRFPDLGAHDQVKLSRQIREEASGTRGSMRTDKTDFELKEEQRLLRQKRGLTPEKSEKPKRKLAELTYEGYSSGEKTVKGYQEYKGFKIVRPQPNIFEVVNDKGQAIRQFAGIDGAIKAIDNIVVEIGKQQEYESSLGYILSQKQRLLEHKEAAIKNKADKTAFEASYNGSAFMPIDDAIALADGEFLDRVKKEGKGIPDKVLEKYLNIIPKEKAEAKNESNQDRRTDSATRKKIDAMTPEEMRIELKTDYLTGLGNKRAFEDSAKKAFQAFIDADSLKWINDNYGHDAGDALLQAIGKSFKDFPEAYHVSGDEYYLQSDSEKDIESAIQKAYTYLDENPLKILNKNGNVVAILKASFSYGTAETIKDAEERAKSHKAERELSGDRAARGEKPPGVVENVPRGDDSPRGEQQPRIKSDIVQEKNHVKVDIPQKEADALTPNEQKKYLIAEIDKAIDSIDERNGRETITFEVPGDGKFKVAYSERSLNQFKNIVKKKFPDNKAMNPPSKKTPSKTSNKRIFMEGVEYYNPFSPRNFKTIIETEKNLDHSGFYGDGYFSDGKYFLKVASEPKTERTLKPSPVSALDFLKGLDEKPSNGAKILGEFLSRNKFSDAVYAHVMDDAGNHFVYPAKKLDLILSTHPNPDETRVTKDGILYFKTKNEIIGVVAPIEIKGTSIKNMPDVVQKGFNKEKYSTTKTPSKNVPTETLKRIQSILSDAIKKGAVAVGLSPDGSIWIRSKNGHGVNIKDVNQISGNQIAFELGRGRMQQDGEIIAGSYEGDTIQITRGVGDTFTVAHETSHWLEAVGALTPLDIATIKAKIKQLHAKGQWQAENKNDIGGPEDRANWLAQQLTMKDPTGLKGIVQKIKAFIDKIFNAFTRTAEGVARDIKSGKVFDMPESIQNHPLKDEIQYATKKINNGAVTMTPSGMAAAAQQAIGTLQERFGKGYQDNDLKVLSRLSGVPILLGKKFKSIGKGVWIEIRGQERREKFLHKQWDDGGLYASMNETKSKAEAEELQGLIWQYNNHKMQGVSESWFAVSNNGQSISLNPLHYEQMEAKLRADGVSPAVVSAYVNIRKSLDGIFIDYHEMLSQNDTIDQNDIQKYRQSLNKINNFFPQMREGDSFTIIKNDKGHTIWREHYDSTFIGRAKGEHLKSKERAEKYAAENGLQKYTIDQGKVEAVPDEAFFNIDTNNMQQVIDAAIQKVTNNKVVGNALSKAVADVLKGRGWSRHTINRKNTPGFKKDDIWGSLHDYLAGYAGFKTKIERAVEHHDNLKTVDSKQNPSEYSYLHKYVKDMLANQDGLDKAVDKVRGVMFVKYLGFNLKSALVNLTQNIVLGAPILSKYTSGAFESERLLSKAMIDVKKSLISKGATYAHLSQAEQSAIKEMHESGSTIDRFLRDLQGDLPNAGWSKYAKKAIEWSGFFMGMAERFNRTSMGLAAYRIGMEKFRGQYAGGALQNKAVEFAKELILDAHFLPGKMNLPEIFRGGAPQKVMRTAYTFRTFTHNYLHTLADLMLNQGPEGRKVFARSMRNLVAVGGLTAIPFFKVFADAFDGGDDDDLETKIRNIAPDKWMKDLLIYGLPGVAGADLSGSMRIDIPRSLEDIIGVPYSVQKDSINFVKSFKSGSKYRMLTDFPLTPMFIRNPMRGIELYSRGQTTRGGRDINYPGEQGPRKISGGETIGKAIGFQPTSVSKAFSSYKATEKVKTAIMEKKARWADQYVNAIRDKDNEKAKEILAEISEHNKKALSEKKFYKVVNVKQMIRNRLRTGGFPGIPKNMRMKALNIANQWK